MKAQRILWLFGVLLGAWILFGPSAILVQAHEMVDAMGGGCPGGVARFRIRDAVYNGSGELRALVGVTNETAARFLDFYSVWPVGLRERHVTAPRGGVGDVLSPYGFTLPLRGLTGDVILQARAFMHTHRGGGTCPVELFDPTPALIRVDSEPPKIQVEGIPEFPAGVYTSRREITGVRIHATDDYGVEGIKVTIRGQPPLTPWVAPVDWFDYQPRVDAPWNPDWRSKTVTVSLRLEGLRTGSHDVIFEAWDLFERKAEQVVRINVDHTPPTVRFLAPVPTAYYTVGQPLRLNFEARDEGSGLLEVWLIIEPPGGGYHVVPVLRTRPAEGPPLPEWRGYHISQPNRPGIWRYTPTARDRVGLEAPGHAISIQVREGSPPLVEPPKPKGLEPKPKAPRGLPGR